jgi:hypothetical protein
LQKLVGLKKALSWFSLQGTTWRYEVTSCEHKAFPGMLENSLLLLPTKYVYGAWPTAYHLQSAYWKNTTTQYVEEPLRVDFSSLPKFSPRWPKQLYRLTNFNA